MLVGFGDEGLEDRVACTEAAAVFADDDGADLGKVRAVEVERAAAEEFFLGFAGFGVGDGAIGDGEVADVLADLGVGAAQERAVVGEGVDEVEDVAGVLQARLVDANGRRGGRERFVGAEVESDESLDEFFFFGLLERRGARCEVRDAGGWPQRRSRRDRVLCHQERRGNDGAVSEIAAKNSGPNWSLKVWSSSSGIALSSRFLSKPRRTALPTIS